MTTRPPPSDADDPLLTAHDVADRTRVSLRTVRRWIADDELEVVQLGRSVRIRKSALDAFLRRRRRRRKK
jgi:excisionase family DNA binding protein